MSANQERVATFARELAEISAREIASALDIPAKEAMNLGVLVADKVCEEFGGQLIYIPTGLAIRIYERDRAMYAYWRANGKDFVATAKQYKVVVKTVYQRIRMIEAADYARRQGGLFPAE